MYDLEYVVVFVFDVGVVGVVFEDVDWCCVVEWIVWVG